MSQSDSSPKTHQNTLKEASRRRFLPHSMSTLPPSTSDVLKRANLLFPPGTKTQIQVTSLSARVKPNTEPSVKQTLSKSSANFSILEGTKYFTSEFNCTEYKNYSEMQDKLNASSVPKDLQGYIPKFLNHRMSSLPSKIVLKPVYVSSQMVSSEATVTSSHNPMSSDDSTHMSSTPYHTVNTSELRHDNPCPFSEEVLCKSIAEAPSEVEGYSSQLTDLKRINSSNVPSISSRPLEVVSLETQSVGHFEFSKSSGTLHISKISDNERKNSSKRNKIYKYPLLTNPLLSSKSTLKRGALHSKNSTFDFVNMSESAFGNLSLLEDQTYRNHIHGNDSGRLPRTVTALKSLSLVGSERITSRVPPLSASRSVTLANASSDHLQRITVLGLFEMTTRAGERLEGRSELAAARLAVRHINEKRLLPGYQLELITNDTKVTGGIVLTLRNETCFAATGPNVS